MPLDAVLNVQMTEPDPSPEVDRQLMVNALRGIIGGMLAIRDQIAHTHPDVAFRIGRMISDNAVVWEGTPKGRTAWRHLGLDEVNGTF